MYPVSANFHTLAIQDAPKTRVRIYFIGDAVDCTDDNAVQTNGTLLIGKAGDTDSNGRIGQNGITFSEFFNLDKNIQVGAAVSSQIGMTLLNTDGALDNFQYGRCKVYLDVYDTANSSWLTCPMGVYIIDLPTKRKVQLVNATGYDQMQKLDEICDTWWSALNWSVGITLSQLLTSLATQIGVSVSSNTASAIVNGSVSFTEEPFQCIEVTYREVLEYIAEATGTVARFDRNGALDLRWFVAAQISGNTVTVNTDTVGNQCLAISAAEYSVAAIDLLKVKLYTDDIGTTVGSGTNQYTIVNNLFLDGANSSAIIAKATPIYNRLHGLGAYSPVSARIITDWSIEAGDIINIVNDSTTYSVPIFQQSMAWRGGYVVSDLLSDGDNVRPVLDYDERTYYRLNSEMSKKVGDNEIISKINQSPESITIQANKVNLTGYVTFTNLSTSGQTTIDGGNITTGTIDASTVTVSNINASNISSGTLSADRIAAGSLAIGKLDSAAQNTINGANSQEQLIYRSKVAGTTSLSGTTTWVTNTTGNQDTWTLKRPTYNSSYPVIFIATQRKDVGGTVTCTTPQIDNTTTVIDGGNIITGTVTANKLNAADINASKILTVGSMTDAAAATVLNSNIAIGGRNLCTGTATAKTLTTEANQNYFVPSVYPLSAYSATALSDASNTQVTVSFDYSITGVDTVFSLTVGFYSGQGYNEIVIAKAGIPIGSSAGHAEATKDITNNMRQYAHENGVLFSGSGNANANAVLTVSNLKVEIGNKATTWTQAPEDVAADIATAQSTAEGANSQEQLIYRSKAVGTTSISGTTTWVTNTTGNQDTWTIKRPQYNTSYPVMFIATQRKTVGGTVTCTTPQIDDTITVIDGGNIITGTVTANQIAGGTITSTNLATALNNTINTAYSNASTALSNAATAQSTAESANSQEQLIYISKASGTTTQSATTTWVTNTTGNQNTWTIKRPTYNSSYPVLFVATQRKSVGGTVTCTTPQIDQTTTVIDGGHITTGTIDASVVSVTNLNASNITTGTMSASKISGGTLTLGGSNNTDGTMTVLDANGVTAATVDNTGITVNGTQSIGGSDRPTTLVLSDGSIVSQTSGQNSFQVGRNSLGGGFLSIYKKITGVSGTLNNAGITFVDGTKPKIRYDYDGFSLRYDNGYGVTDSPAVRMYHDSTESNITFATPPGDSGASTVIGSAGSTFGADATFSANATVNGVLDVTPRRCEATLSAAGWYRAIVYNADSTGSAQGTSGEIVTIKIVYTSQVSVQHEISLWMSYGKVAFLGETSHGTTNLVDKIRYTYAGAVGYVDIHITSSSSVIYNVSFDVASRIYAKGEWVAGSLASVDESPNGETELVRYTFAANSTPLRYTVTTTPVLVTDYGTSKFTVNATYYDLGNIGIVFLNPGTSVLQGVSFSTLLEIENLPFEPISASGYVRALGSNQDGMDTWQVSPSAYSVFLRKRGGGNLVGTFGANPLLQVTIIGVK